jgi:hypothetical protein
MRRRRALLILGGIALAGAAALYWLLFVRLSAEERQLVGRWSRPDKLFSANDVVVVLELNDDRTSRWAIFDAGTGQPLQKAIPARWSVRSGKLTLDYETRFWGRWVRGSPRLQSKLNIVPFGRETINIVAVEPAVLQLQSVSGATLKCPVLCKERDLYFQQVIQLTSGAVQSYARSGELFQMPPIFEKAR